MIQIPTSFLPTHRAVLYAYLADDRQLTRDQWRLLYEAIDALDQAQVTTQGQTFTFRQIYWEQVDSVFADAYIAQLVELDNVRESSALAASFARRVSATLKESRLIHREHPSSWMLWAYCIYWWQSFARGYAFEVEIFHDLTASGLSFAAHDVLNRSERLSPSDLVVLDLLGDLKTSVYFLHTETGELPNDFYITRLRETGHERTLVVFQKTHAWEKINGETVNSTLDDVLTLLPRPVRLQQGEYELIVVEYKVWKQKVLRVQQGESYE